MEIHSLTRKRRTPLCRSFRRAGVTCLASAALFLLIGSLVSESPAWADGDKYVLIGWNDLGMHCINPSYSEIAILPPFNNLWVQVIQRGNPPKIVTSGISLDYKITNNTTVRGKTDFWDYAQALFNLPSSLPLGIGLTGNGLSGQMTLDGDHFIARGIPVLPYNDNRVWSPYQTAIVTLRGQHGHLLDTIKVILPVSDEINCGMCHSKGGDGTSNINGGTDNVNMNILLAHDFYQPVLSLTSNLPVLCAKCHPDNALNAPGNGARSLSLDMHGWHNPSRAPDATCYSCHPGMTTQCFRTAVGQMGGIGEATDTPTCQTGLCHGGMEGMADPTRNPWVTEPTCEQCHGINHTTGQHLYRNSKGHGGIYCAACHNSPHAWWPSTLNADNRQPLSLQGTSYSIRKCSTCHTKEQIGRNPHSVPIYLKLRK
jgi:hypothetical protein